MRVRVVGVKKKKNHNTFPSQLLNAAIHAATACMNKQCYSENRVPWKPKEPLEISPLAVCCAHY